MNDVADVDEVGTDADQRLQHRCELLAAACVGATASLLLYGYLQATAVKLVDQQPGLFEGPTGWEIVEVAALGGLSSSPQGMYGPGALALLVVAYALIVHIGPGELIGRLGTRVLQVELAVAALMVIGASIGVIAIAREGGVFESFQPMTLDGGVERDVALTVVDRTSLALPVLACGIGAAIVGWCTWRALSEVPDVDDVVGDPRGAPGAEGAGLGHASAWPSAPPAAPPSSDEVWARPPEAD